MTKIKKRIPIPDVKPIGEIDFIADDDFQYAGDPKKKPEPYTINVSNTTNSFITNVDIKPTENKSKFNRIGISSVTNAYKIKK